ncbi:unnamed protein product [Calypogeia fissa]
MAGGVKLASVFERRAFILTQCANGVFALWGRGEEEVDDCLAFVLCILLTPESGGYGGGHHIGPSSGFHEWLVYEGWILIDTGHREEALHKAKSSIAIQRSFEAFFLKAYALADTSLDPGSSAKVVELLAGGSTEVSIRRI